jgi:hypothetical protein
MSRRKRLLWIAPLAILGMVVFAFLGGTVVRLLWNWLLPPMFGWPVIGFWQALGLLALCRILFGGFGMRGGGPRGRGRWRERCENMTLEERERFRQRMRERWGFGPPAGEAKP